MYIYKTTNVINNKIYIGLSSKSVNESTNYYGSGRLINEAIIKYGKENFHKEIIEDNIEDFKQLKNREIYWIETLKSHVSFDNYNLTLGGDGSLGLSPDIEWRKKISEAIKNSPKMESTKKIMSEKAIATWQNPEYRAKMSKMRKGRCANPNQHIVTGNIWRGKNLPDYVKEKIRIANSGKSYSDEVNKTKGRPGKCWYYNPITKEQTMAYECPIGFIKGRIINKNKS